MDKFQQLHKFRKLFQAGMKRSTKTLDGSPILPAADIDLSIFANEETTLEFARTFFSGEPIKWHKKHIKAMISKPKILWLNYICIAVARRNPPDADEALDLLRRIWWEYPELMSEKLSLRWIVSTMQAFALCSDKQEEKTIAYAGITYGGLIKIYETERLILNRDPAEEYAFGSPQIKPPEENGFGSFNVGGQDIAKNLHADLFYLAISNDTVGVMLLALMDRLSSSKTVFSRLDNARIQIDNSRGAPNCFCYSTHPDNLRNDS